jgi:sulfate permease, SulP family
LQAVTIGVATVLIILGLRKWRPGWPAFLIAITAAAALTVVTIASRFGELPRSLSQPGFLHSAWPRRRLSSRTPQPLHFLARSNRCSLPSSRTACQDGDIARIASWWRKGPPISVRSCSAVFRSPARSRAPPQTYEPALSGRSPACFTRCFCSYSCLSRRRLPASCPSQHLARFWRSSPGTWPSAKISFCCSAAPAATGSVLLTTFLLIVFVDLTTGIAVGVVLGAFVFLHRMAEKCRGPGSRPAHRR